MKDDDLDRLSARLAEPEPAAGERLAQAAANALSVLVFVAVLAAAPCIVWLWRWAL